MFIVRSMTPKDVPAMMVVNRECFPSPWSAWSIERDIRRNTDSYWLLLEQHPLPANPKRLQWRKLLLSSAHTKPKVFGFGGFWLVNGEMHITNIGVLSSHRGQGWGEVLLVSMLKMAFQLNALFASLEVRISNEPAISLYHKYNYNIVGRKVRYYHDNQEDAHDMVTDHFDDYYHEQFSYHVSKLRERVSWQDQVKLPLLVSTA